MPRRVSLPSAEDLFRRAEQGEEHAQGSASAGRLRSTARPTVRAVPDAAPPEDLPEDLPVDLPVSLPVDVPEQAGLRRPSGRVKHDEKMTVYVTAEELLEVERTRLTLRAHHGLAVDRGRLVREAVAIVLADYDATGGDSALVRRLTGG